MTSILQFPILASQAGDSTRRCPEPLAARGGEESAASNSNNRTLPAVDRATGAVLPPAPVATFSPWIVKRVGWV